MISSVLFFLWVTLPILAWIANLAVGKRVHPAILYFVTCIAGYFLLLATVWAIDAELEAKMNSFDLNGDGAFSGAELTPACDQAMAEWSSDTGRAFAPILGVPYTALWYTILFAFVFAGEWLFRICFLRTARGCSPPKVGRIEPPSDDPNPYKSPTAG